MKRRFLYLLLISAFLLSLLSLFAFSAPAEHDSPTAILNSTPPKRTIWTGYFSGGSWNLNTNTGEMVVKCSGSLSFYSASSTPWRDQAAYIKNVTIEGSCTSIGNYCFANCVNLSSIQIPDTVTSIGNYAFQSCSSLTSLEIPEGITSIGEYAFRDCSALKSISIPASVTSIKGSAFFGCSSLADIEIAQGNTAFSSANGHLYNADGSTLYLCSATLSGTYTVPDSVTYLDGPILANCPGVTAVVLHDNLTWSDDAFTGASGLQSISVSDTHPLYKSIDGVLFSKDGSSLLQYPAARSGAYSIPEGTVTIASHAFAEIDCSLSISLPSTLTTISDYAFDNCSGLTKLTTNSSLSTIGSYAFRNCTGLTTIDLPSTVTSLGSYSFYGCQALTGITIPQSMNALSNYTFYKCESLTEITFPSTLKTLGNYCFAYCTGLQELTIPETITSVGYSCFQDCSGLQTVVIDAALKQLPSSVFSGCSSLRSITLPDSIISISSYALRYCSALESIQLPPQLTTIGTYALDHCSSIRSLDIPDGITTLPLAVFANCTSLESVKLPTNLITIGNSAFATCSSLKSISLPDTVTTLENSAFSDCPLQEIALPSGLTTIGNYALSHTAIKDIFIPKSVTSIGSRAFASCSSLKNAHFLGDAPTADNTTFISCASDFTVRYLEGTSGWTEPQWNEFNCAGWTAKIQSTANCEKAGTDTISCTLCSASCELPAPAWGHKYGPWTLASRPTEELPGAWERICATCSGKSIMEIPAVIPTEQTSHVTNNKDLHSYIYGRWSRPVQSYLIENADGTLSRIEYADNAITVETYSKDYKFLSRKTLDRELPLWGGFYEGKDYFFLVFGQNNSEENNSAEVIRVVRYTKDWLRFGHASLYGANTVTPFASGSLRMAQYEDMLYIHTSHKMYTAADGLNHQANLLFSVSIPQMVVTDSRHSISNNSTGYVSHSFNQFILMDGDQIITLDHGDAHPRGFMLAQNNKAAGNEQFSGNCKYSVLMTFADNVGAHYNDTGAAAGGFKLSDSSYLFAGHSIAQDGSATDDDQHNIFVTVTPRSEIGSNTTVTRWITNYPTDGDIDVSIPYLVKINDQSFLLLWAEGSNTRYVFLDGEGNPVSEIYSSPYVAPSGCEPIVYNNSVCWYMTNKSEPLFFSIPLNDPSHPQSYNADVEITLYAEGYDVHGTTLRRRFGDTYGELPVLTSEKSAITFRGWFTVKQSGYYQTSSAPVTADTPVTSLGDVTLYAHWTRESHTCDYTIPIKTIPANCLSGKKVTYECTYCHYSQTWTWSGKGPHTEVADPYVAPTCITTGLTEGKHCSLCSEVLKAQEIISATGHSYAEDTCCDCGKIRDLSAYVKASTLSPGDYILFVWETGGMELSSFQISGTPVGLGTAYSPNSFSCAASFEVQLGYTDDTFSFKVGEKYLSWNGEDSLSLSTLVDENSSWAVSFDTDGNAIVTNGADSERILRWNETNSHFACYATEQSPIQIYVSAEDEATLVSRSISLHGNIAVNFYMSLADHVAADETAYMRFTLANGEVRTVPMSQCTQAGRRGNQYYVFTCEVSAKEMTDEIKAQFFYADRHTQEYSYCVKTYADKILSLTKDEKLIKLITAMLHYGAASQIQFDYNTQDLANSGLEAVNYEGLQIPFTVNKGQGTALAHFAGASLLLKSETTLRLFFQVEEGVEQFTVTYGEQTTELQQRGGLYYVDIPNIAANKLRDDVCVTIYDGTESAQVSYCPMAYCASVFANAKGQHPQSLLDVVAALYTYHVAASDYLNAR